jgi:hypothetical protein
MKNIIARFAGGSGRAIAVTGHHDTKVFREFRFVGANDGGASTGFLLEWPAPSPQAPQRRCLPGLVRRRGPRRVVRPTASMEPSPGPGGRRTVPRSV